ncbi:hypothetical protein BC937DRAFT_92915 [Endogone sp. FLAS-F59071]|nr:hypothetical protein BC937DRAFT_92915 [Endogone sp. FLAS-F59071]|eukprot:RUS21366.1 hypothetical protein BC937DRAFT_92915 [Endogone sp. FLAS-F59071]
MSGKLASTTIAPFGFFLRRLANRRTLRIVLLLLIVILFNLNFRFRGFRRLPQPFLSDIFALPSLPPSSIPIVSPPTTVDFATSDSLEAWISTGLFPSRQPPFKDIQLDVLYTWVNGSDERLRNQREPFDKAASNIIYRPRNVRMDRPGNHKLGSNQFPTAKGINNEKRFRDNDELRYSIRSIVRNVPFARQITIITTDFPYDPLVDSDYLPAGEFENNTIFRVGQVPQWLLPFVVRASSSATAPLRFVHHSQIFDPAHLPTFNSLAIESHLMDVPDVLPQFMYMNDDTFISGPTTPSDFYTPLYGFVFHSEPHLSVRPERARTTSHTTGEWDSLEWTNQLLSARFGSRYRAYISHIHHMLSSEILREIQLEWPTELNDTASHRFRGDDWDIHLTFLFTHYVIERHREALLHSYLALRLDKDGDGVWSWDERQQVLNVVRKWQGDTDGSALFRASSRRSMSQWKENLERGGIKVSSATNYIWTSADGYAFSSKKFQASGEPILEEHDYHPEPDRVESRVCKINITQCFPDGFENPAIWGIKVDWRKVAFEDVKCGDCLAMILLAESGEWGFEAFLPPTDATNQMEEDIQSGWSTIALIPKRDPQEHSDTTSTFTNPSFDPSILTPPQTPPFLNPFADSSLTTTRQRVIARIHRYSYVFGLSSYSFITLRSSWTTRKDLQKLLSYKSEPELDPESESTKLERETKSMSFFCINDDINTNNQAVLAEVRLYVREFLENWFPGRSPYERWWWEPILGFKSVFTLTKAEQQGKPKRLENGEGARVMVER